MPFAQSCTPVPYKYQQHKETGAKISKFSVLPYGSYEDWETVEAGWTWEVVSNSGRVTEGLCRRPVDTYEEAVEIARKVMKL